MTYFFILGKNPKLSVAEIRAVIKGGDFEFAKEQGDALFLRDTDINTVNLIKHLGGTIKIGQILGKINDLGGLNKLIHREQACLFPTTKKIFFGISNYANYSARDVKRAAMEIKKYLKEQKKSSRWVSSKEKILSSVIVKTNKLLTSGAEICLFKNGLIGKTLSVQEFEEFEKRDYGKPERDILRGMIPPKLARIMINLSGADKSATILDPFCGTGTILIEAAVAGYEKIIGSDSDPIAINQASKNIHWTREQYELENTDIDLFISKAEEISKKLPPKSVDAIISEPFLGPLLKGNESKEKIKKIIDTLTVLYLNAFNDWVKILKPGAKIIIIFPIFKTGEVNIIDKIEKLGYKKLNDENLIYERANQKVKRRVDRVQYIGK